MDSNTPVNSESMEVKIKAEFQNDESNTIKTNNSDSNSEFDKKIEMKNEPLKVSSNSSIPSTSYGTNNSITLFSNTVVKMVEAENTSFESNADSKWNIDLDKSKIKVEPDDNTTYNFSRPNLLLNGVIETETRINSVKNENYKSCIDQSDFNNTGSTLHNSSAQNGSLRYQSTIARVPSTGTFVPSCSVKFDQSNCVSSSIDQKRACSYGKSCYRLNELHRKKFYHPESDSLKSLEKPRCKYGRRCYRKNKEHLKQFIHEKSLDNLSKTRKRKVRNAASQITSRVYESDSSSSLYDDSSDEFDPDDTDSDETDFDPDDDDFDEELLSSN